MNCMLLVDHICATVFQWCGTYILLSMDIFYEIDIVQGFSSHHLTRVHFGYGALCVIVAHITEYQREMNMIFLKIHININHRHTQIHTHTCHFHNTYACKCTTTKSHYMCGNV